jgi:glycosyltransferase involved in cell wall biosynthesis
MTSSNQQKPGDFGVTIIIPTKGRDTLRKSLASLLSQTYGEWQAIVVCDGFEAPPDIKSICPRIRFMSCTKVGTENHAGAVRNFGIKEVSTKWVGFLDDDDVLSNKYVETLKKYDDYYSDTDIVIFTMSHNNKLIPSKWNDRIIQNDVGISFAYKSSWSLSKGMYFSPSSCEDYDHLKRLTGAGASFIIDRDVSYIVRPD